MNRTQVMIFRYAEYYFESTTIKEYVTQKYVYVCVCTQDGEAELWLDDDDFPDDIALASDTDQPPQNYHHKLVEAYLVFIFMWQNIFRVSDVGIGVLLSFIAVLVLLLGKAFGLESLKKLALSLPKSVYSARKLLG